MLCMASWSCRVGWGNHGQGLFWTWWGNLIDILIYNKIFINVQKNTTWCNCKDKRYIDFTTLFLKINFFTFLKEFQNCCPKFPHFFSRDSRKSWSKCFKPKFFGDWYLKSFKLVSPVHYIYFFPMSKIAPFL